MWLLLIEDDVRVADMLKRGLEEEGYTVDLASDGPEGENLALANAYDGLIVDWRLPKKDGNTVVKDLRAAGCTVPILMLTVMASIDSRVAGLDAGADDYLTKPFAFDELLARLRALFRRPPLAAQDPFVKVGPLEIDTERRQAWAHGTLLNLRPKEYALLEVLMRHPNAVISRTALAESVWGSAFYVSDNALDVTVSGLRQKLTDACSEPAPPSPDEADTPFLETIRGTGYRLVAPMPS